MIRALYCAAAGVTCVGTTSAALVVATCGRARRWIAWGDICLESSLLEPSAKSIDRCGAGSSSIAVTSATWTAKSFRPPQAKEVLAAAFFGREPGLELLKSPAGNRPFGEHTTGSGYLSQVHAQFRRYKAERRGPTEYSPDRA